MRILIGMVQIPFVRGGAELLADGLCDALRTAGHEVEIVAIPFKWYPPERVLDHMLACRLLDVTEYTGVPVDLYIGLRFPAYLVRHPNKILWIIHQHRSAYELWDHPVAGDLINFPNGLQVRDAIWQADGRLVHEAKAVFTIAANVSRRLKRYCDIDSTPLYHPPPGAELFYRARAADYIFFPSRMTLLKRQQLVLEALAHTRQPVRVRFAGAPDNSSYGDKLRDLADHLGVHARVEWLGHVTEEQKRHLYAHCLGVVYPPEDEDYGYVTLEAMLSSKPVLTCSDSGEPLEFVLDRQTGLVTNATPQALAAAMDELWEDRDQAVAWGERGRSYYDALGITWENVLEKLLT